jgi:hypothetical protein
MFKYSFRLPSYFYHTRRSKMWRRLNHRYHDSIQIIFSMQLQALGIVKDGKSLDKWINHTNPMFQYFILLTSDFHLTRRSKQLANEYVIPSSCSNVLVDSIWIFNRTKTSKSRQQMNNRYKEYVQILYFIRPQTFLTAKIEKRRTPE